MRTFHINFTGNTKKYLLISAILIAVAIVGSFVFNVSMDIEFRGGSMVTYSYTGDVSFGSFESAAREVLGGDVSVQEGTDAITGEKTFILSMPGNKGIESDDLAGLTERLQQDYPGNNLHTTEITNVDATIGREFLAKCLTALAVAFVLMLLYVAYRFRRIGGLSAGAMGVVALVHDCIIVYGVHVIFGIPISGNFIAVVLTIIGYSLNDTIVIYDRIRENKRLYGSKQSVGELVNLSINQSLIRTMNTSISTITTMIVVCIVALIYDVNSIFTFAFPLIFGLIAGTYSSLCIAGPLWVLWQERKTKAA